jgi:hypothetical protein
LLASRTDFRYDAASRSVVTGVEFCNIQVLAYGQSEYVRQFGMFVDEEAGPLKIQARVLKAPMLKYGPTSKQPTIVRWPSFVPTWPSLSDQTALDSGERRMEHVRLIGSTSQ